MSEPPAKRTEASARSPLSAEEEMHQKLCDESKCKKSLPQPFDKSFYRRDLPNNLVDLTSRQGKARFASAFDAGTAEAFFPLVSQYQTQAHPALCGLTTLSIMLNALNVDPSRVWMHPWRWFSESLLDCCVDMDLAKLSGVTMDQIRLTGNCNGAEIDVLRGMTEEDARKLLIEASRSSERFVAVAYSRKVLNQTGSGHFSPIAAFDEASDSVLILDTARFKYGPYWVDFKQLHQATQPIDKATGLARGYLTFKKAEDLDSADNHDSGKTRTGLGC